MSRVAKNPVTVPAGVEVNIGTDVFTVKGKNGTLSLPLTGAVKVDMVKGVSAGFEKKLQLIGVGYRAQAQGKTLNLSLGFSHPVVYEMPEGVSVATPSQTEIVLTGADKQAVGQAAAEIRGYRPPEPYKGKGVR